MVWILFKFNNCRFGWFFSDSGIPFRVECFPWRFLVKHLIITIFLFFNNSSLIDHLWSSPFDNSGLRFFTKIIQKRSRDIILYCLFSKTWGILSFLILFSIITLWLLWLFQDLIWSNSQIWISVQSWSGTFFHITSLTKVWKISIVRWEWIYTLNSYPFLLWFLTIKSIIWRLHQITCII